MPRITRMQESRGKVRVFVEDEFWAELEAQVALSHGLREGGSFALAELEGARAEGERALVMSRALSYLSNRQRSVGEVRGRLRRYGHGEQVIEEAVDRLLELGYLDDEEFAERFSAERSRRYGPRRVRSELLRAGIDEAVADRKVGEQFQGEEELGQARLLAERRYNSISEKSDKLARRVYNFLLRRGYSPSVCAEVAREYAG